MNRTYTGKKYRGPRKKNLTKDEYRAVISLKNKKDIVIKPADKGSAIVILDKQSYIDEGQKQLHNTQFYEQTDSDLTGEIIHRINLHVHNMLQRSQISQSTCSYLTTDINRTRQFYLLPKSHITYQEDLLSQVVMGPQKKISQFVDHFITSLVPLSQSCIKDSTHLINIINKLTMQPGMLFCTLDITSLHTHIHHNEGIQSIKEILAIHRTPNNLPHNSYIIQLLEVVLTNNHFEFNGKHYHKVSGTAMDTKLAPSYANLFMTKIQEKYVYTYPLHPKLWKRFTDDIFLIWPHGMDSLFEFINHLNIVHSTIKFTRDIPPQKYHFWT